MSNIHYLHKKPDNTDHWLLYRLDDVLMAAARARLIHNRREVFVSLLVAAQGTIYEGNMVEVSPRLASYLEDASFIEIRKEITRTNHDYISNNGGR